MFGNHGLCGLLEEGANEKSPKCLGGNLGDFFLGGILQRSQEVKTVFCCPPYRYSGVFAADAVFYWSVKDEIEIG